MTKALMHFLSAALLLIFSVGCQTTPKANLARFNDDNQIAYPDISILMTSEELRFMENRRVIINALNESRAFESIQVNNPYTEFSIEVHIETTSSINTPTGFAQGMLFACTLGIIPMHNTCEAEGKIKLRFRDFVFDQFQTTATHSSIISIFNVMSEDIGTPGVYRKIIENTIEMIIERRSFEKLIQEIEEEYRATQEDEVT